MEERVIGVPCTRSPEVTNKFFASSWTLSTAPRDFRSRVSFCRQGRSRYLVTRSSPDPFVPSRGCK